MGRQNQFEIHLRSIPGATLGPRWPRVWVKAHNHTGETLSVSSLQKGERQNGMMSMVQVSPLVCSYDQRFQSTTPNYLCYRISPQGASLRVTEQMSVIKAAQTPPILPSFRQRGQSQNYIMCPVTTYSFSSGQSLLCEMFPWMMFHWMMLLRETCPGFHTESPWPRGWPSGLLAWKLNSVISSQVSMLWRSECLTEGLNDKLDPGLSMRDQVDLRKASLFSRELPRIPSLRMLKQRRHS